jgi:hypothetical protein
MIFGRSIRTCGIASGLAAAFDTGRDAAHDDRRTARKMKLMIEKKRITFSMSLVFVRSRKDFDAKIFELVSRILAS